MLVSAMATPKLVLYFDMHSPFAYLVFHVTRTSPVFQGCNVKYVPILLVALIQELGAQPPWGIKNKAEWIQLDRLRWARQFGIPMSESWPEQFPMTSTLRVQRAICACSVVCPEKLADVIGALYEAFWVEGKAVQLPAHFEPVLERVLGPALGQTVTKLSGTQEVKDKLRGNTADALGNGACGLPWITATNSIGETESFWGFDHLGQLIRFLGLSKLQSAHL